MLENDPMVEGLEDAIARVEADTIAGDDPIEKYARAMSKNVSSREEADAKFDREIARAKAGHADVIAEHDRWEKAINWKYGADCFTELDRRLKMQKQRYVPTLFGRVGRRKKAGRVVRRVREGFTAADILAYAREHCPSIIIQSTVEKVDPKDLPVTCSKVYDETIPEEDKFYFEPPKAKGTDNAD